MTANEGLIKLATYQIDRLYGMKPTTFVMEQQKQVSIKYYQQQIKDLKQND